MSVTYFTGTTLGLALSQCWGFATGVVLGIPTAGTIEFFADAVSLGSVQVSDGVAELVLTASDIGAPIPGVTVFTAVFTPEDTGQSDPATSNPVPFTILAPVPFEDTFTRSDTEGGGPGPAYEAATGFDLPDLVSNSLRPNATGADSKGIYYGEPGLNQYVEWDITLDPAQVGSSWGILRADIAANTYYEGGFTINDGGPAKAFIRGFGGALNEVDTSITLPESGDTASFAAYEGQLVLKLNGATILTAPASDGFVGDRAGFGVAATTDVSDSTIDRWEVRVGTALDAPAGGTTVNRIRYKMLHHGG